MLNNVQHKELQKKLKVHRDKLAALSGQNFVLFRELDRSLLEIIKYVETDTDLDDLNGDGVVDSREKAIATESEKLANAKPTIGKVKPPINKGK